MNDRRRRGPDEVIRVDPEDLRDSATGELDRTVVVEHDDELRRGPNQGGVAGLRPSPIDLRGAQSSGHQRHGFT